MYDGPMPIVPKIIEMLLPPLSLSPLTNNVLAKCRPTHVNSSKRRRGFGKREWGEAWLGFVSSGGAAGGEAPYTVQASMLCHTTQDPTGEVYACVCWRGCLEQMDNTAQSTLKPLPVVTRFCKVQQVSNPARVLSEAPSSLLSCPCEQAGKSSWAPSANEI